MPAAALTYCYLLAGLLSLTSTAAGCTSLDQPNPIGAQYPLAPTGTINGSILVLPIPLATAKKTIPSNLRILTHAYRDLLPSFPADKYPLVWMGVHDHGLGVLGFNYTIPDFSRAGFYYPFIDLLGDNTTSFAWVPAQLVSAENPVALAGLASYGQTAYPATFEPACDAYQASAARTSKNKTLLTFRGEAPASSSSAHSVVVLSASIAYPRPFFVNVTNQPIFAAQTGVCDNMIRLWNTSFAKEPYAPRNVSGHVTANLPPTPSLNRSEGVWEGVLADTPFIENNLVPCESLKGYKGSGPGDSSYVK